ncbi:Mrp family chromosome partitioning ATPase [Altererythrobacter atlanticus]|uniref:Tyrosine-protein kinase ptk n=1 Tax=Croceibacterium atlanticum TaxID=1267766 RepID=A0A0F7KRH2_9SPHN|nr:AAA family ATPase [Croceibacterium atlanticum]AKH41716.1 Tyrosine-protein kinase ptk [Croceibacterium atlanticum]MBB5733180.1 Mrp family chromosome partitioning ATPase [Croceibacterium atlanticum]
MTEQSKIPLPPEGEGKEGKSLIERAGDAFGFGNFTPAPVPGKLADAPNRRVAKRAATQPGKAPATQSPADMSSAGDQGETTPAHDDKAAFSPPVPRIAFRAPPVAVDRGHLRESGLIEPDGPVTQLVEEFRIVKRQLLANMEKARKRGDGRAQRVLVCSPLPGEGKTFCATNLALAMAAEKDSEVLLVDADFAKPSILSLLGLQGGKGLMDALANAQIHVEDCVITTDIPGFFVLPAGSQTASDSEFLASGHTAEIFDRLTQGAPNRIVIFDSPPALAASPAAELAKYVSQALVVVRADQTGQSALEDTLSLLSTCPDIQLLLNAANFSPSGRRFGAYYGYGD